MSCTKYKVAVEAAKEAVIHGLNTNEETNTLAELWRHYLGLRHIADNHKHTAEAVDYGYGVFGGQDVISFGDNVIAGASASDTISLG
jgi:hypothetical protein